MNRELIPDVTRTYRYENAEGQLIGNAHVVLGKKTMMPETEAAARRLLRCHLTYRDKQGSRCEVDLLRYLMGRIHQELPIYVNGQGQNGYQPRLRYVTVHTLGHPMAIPILFHECGHGARGNDPVVQYLDGLDVRVRACSERPWLIQSADVERLIELLPPDRKEQERAFLVEHQNFQAQHEEVYQRAEFVLTMQRIVEEEWKSGGDRTQELLEDLRVVTDELRNVKEELRALQLAWKKYLRSKAGLLLLPRKIEERDASAWALAGLRDVRDRYGLDFIQLVHLSAKEMDGHDHLWYALKAQKTREGGSVKRENSMDRKRKGHAADAQEYLAQCSLDTYGATTPAFIKDFGLPLPSMTRVRELLKQREQKKQTP